MIDLTQYRRRATHEVRIGACTIGFSVNNSLSIAFVLVFKAQSFFF